MRSAVLFRVVGHAVLSPAVDDPDPGEGEDADGVWTVLAGGSRVRGDLGRPTGWRAECGHGQGNRARSWRRFSSSRSATSRFPTAPALCSWAGLTPGTASRTPRCGAGTSARKAAPSSGGLRSKRPAQQRTGDQSGQGPDHHTTGEDRPQHREGGCSATHARDRQRAGRDHGGAIRKPRYVCVDGAHRRV